MRPPMLLSALRKTERLRRLIDHERQRPEAGTLRLLRLQSLLLRMQQRLSELVLPRVPAGPLPAMVPLPICGPRPARPQPSIDTGRRA